MAKSVSQTQLKILVDFMAENPSFYAGKFSSHFTSADKKAMWNELAIRLNAQGGCQKATEKWIKTWADWKSATKKKAADIKAAQKGTGGGPMTLRSLTELEERCLGLIGPVGLTGLDVIDPASSCSEKEIEDDEMENLPRPKKRKVVTPAKEPLLKAVQEMKEENRQLSKQVIINLDEISTNIKQVAENIAGLNIVLQDLTKAVNNNSTLLIANLKNK